MNLASLIKTLETEVDIYESFKELEEGKTAVIIEGDIEKLDDVLNNEHMLHMKLQGIEKNRIEAMRSLGLGGKKLVEVIELAEAEDKEKLLRISDDLNLCIDSLKQINDYNTKLIKSRLEVIASVTKLYKESQTGEKSKGGNSVGKSNKADKIYGKNAKILEQSNDFETPVINKKI